MVTSWSSRTRVCRPGSLRGGLYSFKGRGNVRPLSHLRAAGRGRCPRWPEAVGTDDGELNFHAVTVARRGRSTPPNGGFSDTGHMIGQWFTKVAKRCFFAEGALWPG